MVLMLDGNNFSGNLPESITNIYKLVLLDLSNNNFSSNLTDMTTLEHLNIHDNKITSEFLDRVCQISNLYILNLRNNSLYGSIPNCISNLTSLQILDLSSDHLIGDIPPKFGNLAGMIETPGLLGYIQDNSNVSFVLGNRIIEVVVNWKRSKQGLSWYKLDIYTLLDLSMNQLSGEIPTSLGSLKALKLLNVSHNNLYGKLPVSFGDLKNLESLDLSHNNLSGSIPQSLANLQQLTILDVSNNKLTGKIPVGNQMNTMNIPNFYANNSGLCGMQIRVSCSEALSPTKPLGVNSKETWFSWEGVGIGYAVGFFVTMGILYLTDSFVPTKPPNYRRQQRRQRV